MDLISTLNSAWKPTQDDESPFGLLGWRFWEFRDWVDAAGEWVSNSDYTIIDNSIGRICWYRQYNLAWADETTFTLQAFSESKDTLENLTTSWITNYLYNTLTYNDLLDRADYIKEQYFLEVSSPGIERILRKDKHLEANIGTLVEVKMFKAIEGQKVLQGILKEFSKDSINLKVKKISAKDKSGLTLKKLSFDFCANRDSFLIDKFRVELPKSFIELSTIKSTYNQKDKTSNNNKKKETFTLEGRIKNSALYYHDFSAFYNPLKTLNQKEPIHLETDVIGSLEELKINTFNIYTKSRSVDFDSKFVLQNINSKESLEINSYIKKLYIDKDVATAFSSLINENKKHYLIGNDFFYLMHSLPAVVLSFFLLLNSLIGWMSSSYL